ncbi:thiol:disulfide interchange protein TlpA [Rhizobium terrae]|uniref:thiol:disulfide interchange protein TlpA n=1 Tax=Rhizobium terrae TaxID=2171756 RepID=UPI000E3EB3D3|nr:TlpA disulfide reductase family protein [Rhizobium terrae]
MTTKRPFGLPSARLIVIAAVAGVLAGAVAVYVRNTGSGNGPSGSVDGLLAASSGACEGAVQTAKSVSQFSRGQVAAMVAAQPPRPLVLAFKGPDGKDLKTADFSGKTVLLNLWATWCGPCREEMPALNALQKEMGGRDFEVVAVNIDTGSDEKPKAFLAEYGVDALGYYRDSSMGVFNALKKEGLAFGLPVTLVMDKKGCLISAMNGPAAWDSPDAKALITAARGS